MIKISEEIKQKVRNQIRFVYIKKIVKFENEANIKLISYIVSTLLFIFEPFITDFRLIAIRRC